MNTANVLRYLERRRARLRISKTEAARRADLSIATVNRLLSGQEKRPSIDSVSALAEALGLQVILGARGGIREVESTAAFRERQARAKAKHLVRLVQGSMALEAEGVDEETLREMEQQTVHELLAGPPRRLWSD